MEQNVAELYTPKTKKLTCQYCQEKKQSLYWVSNEQTDMLVCDECAENLKESGFELEGLCGSP